MSSDSNKINGSHRRYIVQSRVPESGPPGHLRDAKNARASTGNQAVTLAGITRDPSENWMQQMARNLTDAEYGALHGQRYLLHNRDAKFCVEFRPILRDGGVKPLRLPPSSPDLNAFAERWGRSVKEECLSRLILFGEDSLQHALNEYVAHFHAEHPHQGKGNVLLFPEQIERGSPGDRVECRQRLGGLLRYYVRASGII
jgi:putative transposase